MLVMHKLLWICGDLWSNSVVSVYWPWFNILYFHLSIIVMWLCHVVLYAVVKNVRKFRFISKVLCALYVLTDTCSTGVCGDCVFQCYWYTRVNWRLAICTATPKCTNCNQLLYVRHILMECTSYDQTRHQYYSITGIKNIFDHTPSQNILNFIFKSQLI